MAYCPSFGRLILDVSTIIDNIRDFTPNMMFNALSTGSGQPMIDDIRKYRDRLRALHLSDTPNSEADFNDFVDFYDVYH